MERLRLGHGITGALLVFGLNLAFGLPGSLHPLELLTNALTSIVFGFPMGYAISRVGGGMARGALIGAGTPLLGGVVVGLVAGGAIHPSALVPSAVLGAILGAVLGWHVEQDR